MKVDSMWPWKMLWSDEAHFHLTGYVNTQNCRIWASEIPLATQLTPLHPAVWCEFKASFIIGLYVFEEAGGFGPVTVTVTSQCYKIISCHFSTAWLPQSPGLNPCKFWLWGYLRDVAFSAPISDLAEFKSRIEQHFLNVNPETLRSVVENAVSWFKAAENGEQHIEHALHQPVLRNLKNQFYGRFLCYFWP
ncbi:uncharacterized protein TNCV_3683501 [Trichonephila clavipes]|nr:uncharacterized protein TNCV_3683501 [Trichonephila clavipes]